MRCERMAPHCERTAPHIGPFAPQSFVHFMKLPTPIPVKEAAPVTTQEEREQAAERLRALQRTGAGGIPGG